MLHRAYPCSSRGVPGDDPEDGAGSGVPRLRLVTAAPEGSGPRPPGTTTWLRGARCTDREAMPEMEARPRAENRHGGAPRGAASRSQGTSGRLASARPAASLQANRCLASTGRLSARRHPSSAWSMDKTRAQTRRGSDYGWPNRDALWRNRGRRRFVQTSPLLRQG